MGGVTRHCIVSNEYMIIAGNDIVQAKNAIIDYAGKVLKAQNTTADGIISKIRGREVRLAMVPAKESSDKDPDESLVGRECMVELMGVGQG